MYLNREFIKIEQYSSNILDIEYRMINIDPPSGYQYITFKL
jgi:hypothetical protein